MVGGLPHGSKKSEAHRRDAEDAESPKDRGQESSAVSASLRLDTRLYLVTFHI